jgi:tRNA (guanine-N7-)-methyltransferase
MPHVIAKNFLAARTPFERDGLRFAFASIGSEGVAGVQSEKSDFLLRFFPYGEKTIVKVDKSTRPPFLGVVKRALIAFVEGSGATIAEKNFGDPKEGCEYDHFYEPAKFLSSLDRAKALWIEIGFGSGRHILQNAKLFANALHLGVEIHAPSAERLLKRAKAEKLENVAALLCDARTFLSALPSSSCEKIFVHFPVPWYKSPSRRVFSEPFVKEALRVLKQNGELSLRTDSEIYFNYALDIARLFAETTIETKQNAEPITRSKYEDRWRRMDKTIFDLILTKKNGGESENGSYRFEFPKTAMTKSAIERDLIANKEGFLLRVRERWELGEKGVILGLIMGDPLALQNLYLLIDGENARYFPCEPLPTRANFFAHRALIEALYE